VASADNRYLTPPTDGLWRIGRHSSPLAFPPPLPADLRDSRAGHRFDSYTGSYSVLHFGSDAEACFGETLVEFRPDPALASVHDGGFMAPGSVPKEWRDGRVLVRVRLSSTLRFLNVEDADVRSMLWRELGPVLKMCGVDGLTVDAVRGPDRRVTRLISEWAHTQRDRSGAARFAGVRFLSRHNSDWECWAVFDRVPVVEDKRFPIPEAHPALLRVSRLYGVRVF
jgi:hypothetical protein